MTKLTDLEEIVWAECVGRMMPPDSETQERWESDKFAMHQEHFQIRPLLLRPTLISTNEPTLFQVEFGDLTHVHS